MRRTVTVTLAAATLAAVAFAPSTTATANPSDHLFKRCATEDSVSCVWDARHQGNGLGDSYFTDAKGRNHYVSHATAHAMLDAEGTWRRVDGTRWEGVRFDSVSEGVTFRLGSRGWISVGPTTWAKQAGMVAVGSS